MADTTVVDIFKFVAVRPAQKPTVQDADEPFLRDARADNPDRQRDLAELYSPDGVPTAQQFVDRPSKPYVRTNYVVPDVSQVTAVFPINLRHMPVI